MKRLVVVAALAITVWQVLAGIARCGSIDGGVLVVPVAFAAWYLVRGVANDLRGVLCGTSPRRRNANG